MTDLQPIELCRLVDEQCDAFERALAEGKQPSIASFLDAVSPAIRRPVLVELLAMEMELTARSGHWPDMRAYENQFPAYTEEISRACDAFQAWAQATGAVDGSLQSRALKSDDETARQALETGSWTPADPESAGMAPLASLDAARPHDDLDMPRNIGRYEVLRKLGQGGMGTVLLSRDTVLDRNVALKLPHFETREGDEAIARFYREARAMATVHHANLCPIYDVGEIDGHPYLTMAYIEGQSLAECIALDGPMDPHKAVQLVRKLALAMQAVHEAGVLHRDLKPSNVMIDQQGEPFITDFGLASRDRQSEADLTHSGTVIGSPAYMAPEQVSGVRAAVGPHTDVYALGVILYQLLCGRRPFEGKGLAVLGQIASGELPTPPSELANVDRQSEAICLKAMAHRIEDRYQSAAELASALERLPRQEAVAPRVFGLSSIAIGAVFVTLVVGAIATAVSYRSRGDVKEPVAGLASEPGSPSGQVTTRPDQTSIDDPAVTRSDLPLVKVFVGADSPITDLSFTSDSRRLVSGHLDGEIGIWNVESGEQTECVDGLGEVCAIDVSPDDQTIAVGTSDTGIQLFRLADLQAERTIASSLHHILDVDWTPDGKSLVAANYDGNVVVYSVATGEEVKRLWDSTSRVATVAFSQDGQTVIAANNAGTLSVWNVSDWELRTRIGDGHRIAAPSPTGTLIAANATLFDTATGLQNANYTAAMNPMGVQFTADERHVLTCGQPSSLTVTNIETGRVIAQLETDTWSTNVLALSADGRHVITGGGSNYNPVTKSFDLSGDNTIRMWRLPASVWPSEAVDLARSDGAQRTPQPVPSKPSAARFDDSGQELGKGDSRAVRLGDFDKDGDLDAFVVNRYDHPNRVWLNDGQGTYRDSGQELGNAYSWDVALGDVDNDGDLDAAVVNCKAQPSRIWINDGQGSFSDSGHTITSIDAHGIGLADLDGDGDLDVMIADLGANRVWRNDGNGRFSDSGQQLGDASSWCVALADLNGDSSVDAFVGNRGVGAKGAPNRVWFNDGRGNFTDSGQLLHNASTIGVSWADLNGDGTVDVFAASDGSQPNRVWLNDGKGRFRGIEQPDEMVTIFVALGDLDGDGDIDAFAANSMEQPNQVLLNNGQAEFLPGPDGLLGSSTSSGAALGDLDGDGDLDAFVSNFREQPNRVWINSTAVATSDSDRDGDVDVIVQKGCTQLM